VHSIAASTPGIRIALVGASIGDSRSVMVEGVSGLTAVAVLRQRRISWEPSLGRVKWPNGSEAQIFSGDHADGLRGPEHDFAWCIASARPARGRSDRGNSSIKSAGLAADRRMLHCRGLARGRMGGKEPVHCRLHQRRLAIHRARGGDERLC
jgi:phage terminase large subunit-like protein